MVDKVEDLKTYLAVLDAGGVNAAASELGIAKSAVSRRLSDLEKRVGLNLLDRTNRKLEPTAVGIEYARRARAILASLDDLDSSLGSGPADHTLSIQADPGIIAHKLVPALATAQLREQWHVARFTVGGLLEAEVVVAADEGRAAKGAIPLFASTLVICASPAFLRGINAPTAPEDLDAHAAIVIEDGEPPRWRMARGDRRVAQAAVVVPDAETALAAAIAGLGVVQLPDYLVAAALADGRLDGLLGQHEMPSTQWIATFSEAAGLSVRRFVDTLAAALS